jgi:hypothetical protein
VLAGFDDAFAKHPRIHQTLARLLMEITKRFSLGRQQLKLSQARRDAELLLTTVLAASDAAVVILDGDGRVTVANAQFSQMAGRPLADILSRPLWPLLHSDGAASLRSVLQDGQGAGPVGLTVTVLGRGTEIPTHVRALARELREQRRLAVVSFRPATAGSGPASSLLRPREPAPAATAEQLSTTLRLLRTTPVVARIRLGECNRLLARAGALPPEAMATLQLTLRRTLHELLTDEDFIAGAGEDTYLLLSDESVLRAMRRLGRTIPALRAALLNSPELAHDLLGLGGAPLVEQLDQLCDLQVLVAPVELALEDVGHDDPATLLAGRLQAQEAALGAEVLRSLNELRMHAVCELRMVQDKDGAPSALCLACINEAASGRFAELAELAQSRPELAFQLSLLHLELAVETLAREVDRDSALAVVELHFSVLGHRRLAERYLERCRALPPKIARGTGRQLPGRPARRLRPQVRPRHRCPAGAVPPARAHRPRSAHRAGRPRPCPYRARHHRLPRSHAAFRGAQRYHPGPGPPRPPQPDPPPRPPRSPRPRQRAARAAGGRPHVIGVIGPAGPRRPAPSLAQHIARSGAAWPCALSHTRPSWAELERFARN